MRINKFVATATGISRRVADNLVASHRVQVNNRLANVGTQVSPHDTVTLDGKSIKLPDRATTIILNKPVGYVCSRAGQGSQTIYSLIPPKFHHLKPVGRLDKDSSGLLVLTNDGGLANELTHPRYGKTKIYEVLLDKALQPLHQQMITNKGIQLEDGLSKLVLNNLDVHRKSWKISMKEGRNRQIRRTFAALDYNVISLKRIVFGSYRLDNLGSGKYRMLEVKSS